MNPEVKKGILAALRGTLDAINKASVQRLSELSTGTIENAAMYQDGFSIEVAVVIYALSKQVEHNHNFDTKTVTSYLKNAISLLDKDDIKQYGTVIKKIIDYINQRDGKVRLYVRHALNEAQIKQGSKLYENGLSLAKTAEILGISRWELMHYIGRVNLPNACGESCTVQNRVGYARKIFGVK